MPEAGAGAQPSGPGRLDTLAVQPAEAPQLGGTLRWQLTFLAVALALFVIVDHYTGLDVIAASARFIWNIVAVVAVSALRAAGGLLALLARGVGVRRLSRLMRVIAGVGLSYSGGVLLSEPRLRQAKGWTGKVKALAAILRLRWQRLPLGWKLAIVATLVASQVYLHFLLIIFPIAFLIPVVRRLWIQAADIAFGKWYWKIFGSVHRSAVATVRRLPVVRGAIGAARLARIRYLCAWRLWRYDPRYREAGSSERVVSFLEPIRLWRRGGLDRYVGNHLLCGRKTAGAALKPEPAPRG